jgi:hypothetical protein
MPPAAVFTTRSARRRARTRERNLLQPYVDSAAPDPRFWVMLGLATDHIDVIEFVGRYTRQHPSSRTTTELLFLLDELAEANRGAFDLLLRTDVASLTGTAASSPEDVQLASSCNAATRSGRASMASMT